MKRLQSWLKEECVAQRTVCKHTHSRTVLVTKFLRVVVQILMSRPNFVSNILYRVFLEKSLIFLWLHGISGRIVVHKMLNSLRVFCASWCVSNFVGKLLGRTQKIAYNLLHKVGPKGDPSIKPGDRVRWLQMSSCLLYPFSCILCLYTDYSFA